ncbi:hypothetical protein P3S67_017568 [Capsicum chacoense]
MGPNHLQGKKKFSVPSSSKDTSKCINGQINRSKYGETGVPYDVRTSRKRGLTEGSSATQSARMVLAVLGEGSAAKPRRKVRMLDNIEKPNTLFNQCANGGGWWDCNMEGVDNEEVGCNEVWEGMGSTTIGGLEWH